MNPIIKIALSNENELFRKALVSLLSNYENLCIVHESSNEKELIKTLNIKEIDIVLLDVETPQINGMEALKMIKNSFPDIKIIVLNMHHEEALMAQFIIKGANGFVTKQSTVEILLETITGVYNNHYYFKQNIASDIIKEIRKHEKLPKSLLNLTRREIEILNLICKGKTHKEIADLLFIAIRTVDFHKANIYKKTNTHCAVSLYEYSIVNSLITI